MCDLISDDLISNDLISDDLMGSCDVGVRARRGHDAAELGYR